jgi:lipoate-protein ligase A
MAERQVIAKILDSPNLVEEFHKKGIIIHDSGYRKILAYLTDYYESNGIIVIADIVSKLDKDLGEMLIEISEEDYPPMSVDELINILVNEFPNSKTRQETLDKINEISDPKEQALIAAKLISSIKTKKK